MIPVLATILRICAVLVLAAGLLLAINGISSTSKSIKETRQQIKQAQKIIKENPMYAAQYGQQLSSMQDSVSPVHVMTAYVVQSVIPFILGAVLMAFFWGIGELFLAVRAIEYNTRAAIAGAQSGSEAAAEEIAAPVAG
jgi:predicted PurR-regulated permease PerM